MRDIKIIDTAIAAKCRRRCGCYLCQRKHTRPYVIPEKEIIEIVYTSTSSLEVLKAVKVFWLCDEHYELFQQYYENKCNSRDMDDVIEGNCDTIFLGKLIRMFDITMDTLEHVRRSLGLTIAE